MSRTARIVAPGIPHHIVQRGHNRSAVFATAADYRSYLRALFMCRDELEVKVRAYCLMTNHVHLIVDPGDDALRLSRLMQRLAARHTIRMNKQLSRTGTVWEGRFHCSPIETDRYLLACCRYVELNPVRAGIVRRPDQYPWSSYRDRMKPKGETRIDLDVCFMGLARDPVVRRERYSALISAGTPLDELELFRSAVRRNRFSGDERTAQSMAKRFGWPITVRRGRRRSTTLEDSSEK